MPVRARVSTKRYELLFDLQSRGTHSSNPVGSVAPPNLRASNEGAAGRDEARDRARIEARLVEALVLERVELRVRPSVGARGRKENRSQNEEERGRGGRGGTSNRGARFAQGLGGRVDGATARAR